MSRGLTKYTVQPMNIPMAIIIKRLERFVRLTYCTVCRDMDEYVSAVRTPNTWRLFMVLMTRVALGICAIRFAIMTIAPNHNIGAMLLLWDITNNH